MIAREQIRGARPGDLLGWERYRAALVGNRFHYAPVRHLLLAALHSSDGLKAGRWEQIFRFDAQPARLPRKAASGVGPQLSDLAEAIARVGLRQLDRERRRLTMVCEQLERSEEHTSELQSLMRISYAVLCLNKKTRYTHGKYTSN